MNRDDEFEKWYDEYFDNAQGEDSPYSYNDVKIAFYKGFQIAKENLTKHNIRKIQLNKKCKKKGCTNRRTSVDEYCSIHND